MLTIGNMKGQLLRIWTEEEQIEDELERTFEITGDYIYEFDEGYPVPDRSGVMAHFCKPKEGGKIRVAKVIQLTDDTPEGELIWSVGEKEFTVVGANGNTINEATAFIFLPFATEEDPAPEGGYMTSVPSLPIAVADGYEFALKFAALMEIEATPDNINRTMADLMMWIVQMYKISQINAANCAFAEMLYEKTKADPRFQNMITISNKMSKTPFSSEEIADMLLEGHEDE